MIAQRNRVVDHVGKLGVHRGFAVARKGDYVGAASLTLHPFERLLQLSRHLLACGVRRARTVVAVEATFAIDAIEGAKFTVGRQKIDAQRDTEPATVHRAEDGRREKNRRHKFDVAAAVSSGRVGIKNPAPRRAMCHSGRSATHSGKNISRRCSDFASPQLHQRSSIKFLKASFMSSRTSFFTKRSLAGTILPRSEK